jgi:hypothetical protein
MLAYEPEVSLAVRMHGETTSSTSEEEENGEIDEFLSSYGFEYVCVTDDAERRDDGKVTEAEECMLMLTAHKGCPTFRG